jgi:hypothetical protein
MGIEERIHPAIAFKPELASLNMGSLNFGLFPMLERFNFKEFRHSWERDYLEAAGIWYSEIPLGMLSMRCRPVRVMAPASLRAGKVKSARRRLRTSRPLPITHHRALLFLFRDRSQPS